MAIRFLSEETREFFENPESLLFRVLPLDRVMEMIEKKKWAFVSPTLWNDPFERAFLEAEFRHKGKVFYLPIKPVKNSEEVSYRLFSICLTETNESEAFWKTYSPNGDGVRLTIKAVDFKKALLGIKNYDVYIGKAVYENYETLYSFQENAELWSKLQSKVINDTHLRLMLKKRLPFKYENEVRVMLLRKIPMTKAVAKVSIKSTINIITGIKLDPRMGIYMAKMLREVFATKGFDPAMIRKSKLYSKPESVITFKEDLDTVPYEIY